MIDATTIIAREVQSGNTEVDGFKGGIRSLGPNKFQVGDLFVIPKDFKVFKNAQLSSADRDVLYTVVEMMANKETSLNKTRALYPSMFQNTIYAYKMQDGVPVRDKKKGYVVSSGTAVDAFHQAADLQSAFKAIAGKVLKITASTPIVTAKYNPDDYAHPTETDTREVYTVDFA